jgi:hypothetical protein
MSAIAVGSGTGTMLKSRLFGRVIVWPACRVSPRPPATVKAPVGVGGTSVLRIVSLKFPAGMVNGKFAVIGAVRFRSAGEDVVPLNEPSIATAATDEDVRPIPSRVNRSAGPEQGVDRPHENELFVTRATAPVLTVLMVMVKGVLGTGVTVKEVMVAAEAVSAPSNRQIGTLGNLNRVSSRAVLCQRSTPDSSPL